MLLLMPTIFWNRKWNRYLFIHALTDGTRQCLWHKRNSPYVWNNADGFNSSSVLVGFVVHNWHWDHVFLWVLLYFGCQYYSANAPHSYLTNLRTLLYKLLQWWSWYIKITRWVCQLFLARPHRNTVELHLSASWLSGSSITRIGLTLRVLWSRIL